MYYHLYYEKLSSPTKLKFQILDFFVLTLCVGYKDSVAAANYYTVLFLRHPELLVDGNIKWRHYCSIYINLANIE